MKAALLAQVLEAYNELHPRTRLFATHALRQLTPPALNLLLTQDDSKVPEFITACREAGVLL